MTETKSQSEQPFAKIYVHRELGAITNVVHVKGLQWRIYYDRMRDVTSGYLINSPLDPSWTVTVKVTEAIRHQKVLIPTLNESNRKFELKNEQRKDEIELRLEVLKFEKVRLVCCYDFSEKNTLADRILLVDGTKFYVDSRVLVFYSEYFAVLFERVSAETRHKEIALNGIHAEYFRAFLGCVFPSCESPLTDANVEEVAALADYFCSAQVKTQCAKHLKGSKIDCIEKFDLACAFDLPYNCVNAYREMLLKPATSLVASTRLKKETLVALKHASHRCDPDWMYYAATTGKRRKCRTIGRGPVKPTIFINRDVGAITNVFCIDGLQWKITYDHEKDTVSGFLLNALGPTWSATVQIAEVDINSAWLSPTSAPSIQKLCGLNPRFVFANAEKKANMGLKIEVLDYKDVRSACCYDFSEKNTRADRILQVDYEMFHVESGILAFHSDHFSRLFKEDRSKGIDLIESSAEGFRAFLDCIFPCCKSYLNGENVMEAARLAHVYGSTRAKLKCAKFLKLCSVESITVHDLAQRYDLPMNLAPDCCEVIGKQQNQSDRRYFNRVTTNVRRYATECGGRASEWLKRLVKEAEKGMPRLVFYPTDPHSEYGEYVYDLVPKE